MTNATLQIQTELTGARAALHRAWDLMPPEGRKAPAPDGGWSPLQILDHIAKAQASVVHLIEGLKERGRAGAVPLRSDADHVSRLKSMSIVEPAERVHSPPAVEPGADPDETQVWSDLKAGLDSLLRVLAETDGWDFRGTTFEHAVLGSLNLHEWIVFSALHERRHVGQIDRLQPDR